MDGKWVWQFTDRIFNVGFLKCSKKHAKFLADNFLIDLPIPTSTTNKYTKHEDRQHSSWTTPQTVMHTHTCNRRWNKKSRRISKGGERRLKSLSVEEKRIKWKGKGVGWRDGIHKPIRGNCCCCFSCGGGGELLKPRPSNLKTSWLFKMNVTKTANISKCLHNFTLIVINFLLVIKCQNYRLGKLESTA